MIYRIIRSGIQTGNLQDAFLQLAGFVIALYFAIVLHEVAHGFVAHLNGDDTAKINGRLTLNPIKHIDPVGALMMLMVGIGWARPVPIDPRNFRRFRTGMVTTALAGVTANLIMAVFGFGMTVAMQAIANAVVKAQGSLTGFNYVAIMLFYYLFIYMTLLNISLFAFNLLPIAPLDGFRLVETFTPPGNWYVRFMYRYGRYLFLVFILLGLLADFTGWPCDVLGMYIGVIRTGIIKLLSLIFGVA